MKLKKIFTFVSAFIFAFTLFTVNAFASEMSPTIPYLKITIFSSMHDSDGGSGPIGGHSWVQIENFAYGDDGDYVDICGYSLAPFKKVTISVWGNLSAHQGVWYNVEVKKRISNSNAFSSERSYSKNTSYSSVSTINAVIINYNHYSSPSFVCSTFSALLWNSLFPDDSFSPNLITNNYTPSYLYGKIALKSGYQTNYFSTFTCSSGYYDALYGFVPSNV